MYTRKDYLNNKCTHRQYYAQFVNDNVKLMIKDWIGIKRLLKSKDKYLNDIPLNTWDKIGLPYGIKDLLKKAGDFYTLAGQVCILKEAARQMVEDSLYLAHEKACEI